MARWLYTAVFTLLLPLILFRLWRRGAKQPAYRTRVRERFGCTETINTDKNTKTLWLHTVSVGEFIAAHPLIKHFVDKPEYQVLITCTTPTGSERIKAAFGDYLGQKVHHCYLPYDIPFFINRFLKATKPSKFVCLETELWPNLLHCCKQQKIPVILANARLSEKSAKGYQKFSSLSRTMLESISVAAIQNNEDAQRFIDLGLPQEHTRIIGNIKFDLDLSAAMREQALELKRTLSNQGAYVLLIAASTHKGEDDIILEAYQSVKSDHDNVRLILVPRHPERFNDVFQLCDSKGLLTIRRSNFLENHTTTFDVLVGDTMGELMLLYGASDMAFVGGSLVNNGGHNYIEAAAWALPIASGNSRYNFREIAAELEGEQALTITQNSSEISQFVSQMLLNKHERDAMGKRAHAIAERNRGAMDKLIDLIESPI